MSRQEEDRKFWESVSDRLTTDVDKMDLYIGCLCFFGEPGQWTYRVDYLDSTDDSYEEERFLASYEDYWYRWCCPVLQEDFEYINRKGLKNTDKRNEELEGL
ncbi:MAG: hypothetical protein J6Q39_04190 [Bacteroidales bacterium]|nr:hypothetical protein [Bacteroidales bacterium]